jgi:hypothetical protein
VFRPRSNHLPFNRGATALSPRPFQSTRPIIFAFVLHKNLFWDDSSSMNIHGYLLQGGRGWGGCVFNTFDPKGGGVRRGRETRPNNLKKLNSDINERTKIFDKFCGVFINFIKPPIGIQNIYHALNLCILEMCEKLCNRFPISFSHI